MRVYKNQIIAKEGVLAYEEYGNLLKRWDDLQKFIGERRPVWDDHSEKANQIGYADIKKCPIGRNLLCADIYITDDKIPKRNGYSIGAPSRILQEDGFFGSLKYNAIQEIQDIEHIAYIDNPRDTNALQVGDTSLQAVQKHVFINNNDNTNIILCDEYVIVEEKIKMTNDEKNDSKLVPDHTDDIKKIKDEYETLRKQMNELVKDNTELREFKDSVLMKERNQFIQIIKDKIPEFVADEKVPYKLLEFGASLISRLKPESPEESIEKVIERKKLDSNVKDENLETFDVNSLYTPKGDA
jgi:hypothetical protein